jgi:hypothetical protein
MKRKVFCNRGVCSLDRLPEQQIGGGLRVQSSDYLVPLLQSAKKKRVLIGKGKIVKNSKINTKNKRSCYTEIPISRSQAVKRKQHGN